MSTDPTEIDGIKSLRQSDETPERANLLQRIVNWLRGGYPHGVPREDYVALFGVLHRQLTEAEVERVVRALIASHPSEATISSEAVGAEIRRDIHQAASPGDIARVNARLAAGGWPLAAVAAPIEEQQPEA